MTFIDGVLRFFGLQRASTISPSEVQGKEEEAKPLTMEEERRRIFDESWDRQRLAIAKMFASGERYYSAIFERMAELLESVTSDIQNGTITEDTLKRYEMYQNFKPLTPLDTSAALSPEVEQALKDALERRGKENEEEGKE